MVTEVIPPSNGILSGSTTEVTFTVKNQGTLATSVNWNDALLFVPTPEIIGPGHALDNHIVLGNFANQRALAPGESYRQTVTVTLPEDQIGTWYIAAYADAILHTPDRSRTHLVPELDEFNNVSFAPFTVTLAPQPDLIATGITTSPNPVFSGQELEVRWTESNQGTGPTDLGATRIAQVYLSTTATATIDPDHDFLLGTRTVSTLIPPGGKDDPMNSRLTGKRVRADLHGTYYAKVNVNANRAVTEVGGFGNNVAVSSPFEIILSVPVDLAATGIQGPATGVPGHTVPVTWSAKNIGAEPEMSLGWKDGIWLSTDKTLDRKTDILLDQVDAATALVNGAISIPPYSRTRNIRLPNNLAAGNYYFIVALDDTNTVYELDSGEANNILASTQPITISLVPTDLSIETGFDASHPVPEAADAGQKLNLSWRVTNTGTIVTPVDAWKDRVWLSSNQTLDSGASLLLDVAHQGALAAGANYVETGTATLPLVNAGDYYLLFQVDAEDKVYEQTPGEENNLLARPFTIRSNTADLVVESISASNSVPQGGILLVAWEGHNIGTLSTNVGAWTDTVLLSKDNQLGHATELAKVSYTGGVLAPDGRYAQSAVVNLPKGILPGTYSLFVQADARNQVFEANNDNNYRLGSLVITSEGAVLSNLIPSAVQAPASGIAGQTLKVSWTDTNTGSGATEIPNWNDGVYLSPDGFFDRGSDTFIGSAQAGGILAAGASRQGSLEADLPRNLSGNYTLFVMADLNKQVYESNENDNVAQAVGQVTISQSQPSDLVVTAVNPPANAVLGQTVRMSWELTNAGNKPISGRWEDSLYLSTDTQWDINDPRLGSVQVIMDTPMQPGEKVTVHGDVTIPATLPGAYHVFVRTDVRNQIPETNETNNLSAASAATMNVNAIPLTLGTPYNGDLAGGKELYFQFDAAAGDTIRLRLDHSDQFAWTELYVRYGEVPTPGQFDFMHDAPSQPNQKITIPTSQAGRYYVLAKKLLRASSGCGGSPGCAGESTGFRLLAEVVPFAVTSISPKQSGNQGTVTVLVKGTRFNMITRVYLTNNGGNSIEPEWARMYDATTIAATFNLSNVQPGEYDFHAAIMIEDISSDSLGNPGIQRKIVEESVVNNGFSVLNGGSGLLKADLQLPLQARLGTSFPVVLSIKNTGINDSKTPLIQIISSASAPLMTDSGETFSGAIQVMPFGSIRPDVIAPGEQVNIAFSSKAISGNSSKFTFEILDYGTLPIDWTSSKNYYRNIGDENWDTTWVNFLSIVGQTWESLHDAMRNSTLLS
ncbi:hypothetical protein CCP4SC76_2410001 [Gammaproteobacteria bacterium]